MNKAGTTLCPIVFQLLCFHFCCNAFWNCLHLRVIVLPAHNRSCVSVVWPPTWKAHPGKFHGRKHKRCSTRNMFLREGRRPLDINSGVILLISSFIFFIFGPRVTLHNFQIIDSWSNPQFILCLKKNIYIYILAPPHFGQLSFDWLPLISKRFEQQVDGT